MLIRDPVVQQLNRRVLAESVVASSRRIAQPIQDMEAGGFR